MIERKQGAVISLASMAGWIGSDEGEAHYCAAKAGVMAFTRAVAAEVGRYGIRINAIAPGLVYNPFLERIYPPEFFERLAQRTPLGGWVSRRTSPTWRPSWPATSRATSQERCSASAAACT